MRKVKLQMQLSADGFVAGPNGEMDWMVWDWDDELKKHVNELTDPVDCILLGRVLAQGFIDAWASRATNPESTTEEVAFSHKMNDTPKIVFSKTLSTAKSGLPPGTWKNTTLAKGNLVEEITTLKKQPGKDIIAYGGATFVSNLIKEGLIDEYHLFMNPAALGKGMAIFKGLENHLNFTLVKAKSFSCGIVAFHYEPKK